MSTEEIAAFRRDLLTWFDAFQRDLPWRRTRDPYAIWLSEVMLQQTRVAAAIPYYERFLQRFPSIAALAAAAEPDLLAHWAGLGYYYRARNLHHAARSIAATGAFPSHYDEIKKLPGVGDYTAAAVASIAFGLPHAAVDGNVLRVLSRVRNDFTNIASNGGRKRFAELAQQMLDEQRPGAFNQALMELGAVICLPKKPQCLVCPVASHCQALARGNVSELPVKIMAVKSVREERTLFWIEKDGQLLVWQRDAGSRLMPGFWELPERTQLTNVEPGEVIGKFKHGITFHDYRFQLVKADAGSDLGVCCWCSLEDLATAPLSTIFRKAIAVVQNLRGGPRVMKVSTAASG